MGAAVCLLLLSSCKEDSKADTAPRRYPTETLAPVSRTWQVGCPAVLRGRQNVEIRPQCSGLITRICIEEGADVRKGQTLFVIDRAPYLAAVKTAEAGVAQAEARLATARLTLEGKENLYRATVVSEFELKTARNEMKEAEAALRQAKARHDNALTELSYTEVKSPVDGVAGMIPYRVGALVDRNIAEPLVCVADTKEMFAYFSVPENSGLARSARRGGEMKVGFRSVDKSAGVVGGVIDAVSGTVDARTGTISLRARIPNRDGTLYDGGTGTVLIPQTRTGCLVVPQTATYEIQNRTFIYKVVDGRAVSAAVEVEDIGNGKEYVVTAGLKAGDTVVTDGAGLLREGTEIAEGVTRKSARR